MVKSVALLCLAALVTAAEGYTTKYNINLDMVLKNKILYKKYFNCLANNGECSKEGKELKDVLPEVLSTDCAKCNKQQKLDAEKILKFMIENKPEDFTVLEKIYDPDGLYKKKYAGAAEKIGIKLN